MDRYDVIIIGGGAAGLSAALVLARARRSIAVVDAGAPRNAPAAHLHGYLSREGVAPPAGGAFDPSCAQIAVLCALSCYRGCGPQIA